MEIKGKKIGIIGLGIEGIALVEFFLDKAGEIVVFDKFEKEELINRQEDEQKNKLLNILSNNEIKTFFGPGYLDALLATDLDIVFRSPGISPNLPAIIKLKERGVVISSQIKLFFDLCQAKIIGVTGTKGKGTTASLISEILKKNQKSKIKNQNLGSRSVSGKLDSTPTVYLAGNIGYPAITLIPFLQKNDIVILELSSFQLSDLDKSPHIALITNLLEDHLDYHTDLKEYHDAKYNILKHQTDADYAVLNTDSTFSPQELEAIKSKKIYFSALNEADSIVIDNNGVDEVILDPFKRKIKICDQSTIKLIGKHNLLNIAAASLTADLLGIDIETIKDAVKNFEGLPHRLELVDTVNNRQFVNDSFATNPEPTMAAIKSFKDKEIILLLGGSSKGANFDNLSSEIKSNKIKAVILLGEESQRIKESLLVSGFTGQIVDSNPSEMGQIIHDAYKLSDEGDVILLSPACASFGMFKNYKDRGNKFREEVKKIR